MSYAKLKDKYKKEATLIRKIDEIKQNTNLKTLKNTIKELNLSNNVLENKQKELTLVKKNINTVRKELTTVKKILRSSKDKTIIKKYKKKVSDKEDELLNLINKNSKINEEIKEEKKKIIKKKKEIKKTNNNLKILEEYYENDKKPIIKRKMDLFLNKEDKEEGIITFNKKEDFDNMDSISFVKMCLEYYKSRLNHISLILEIETEGKGSIYYTLNTINVEKLLKSIEDYLKDIKTEYADSVQETVHVILTDIRAIKFYTQNSYEMQEFRKKIKENSKQTKLIEKIKKQKEKIKKLENKIKKRRGGYFGYYNLTDIDLSRYNIYKKNDEKKFNLKCLVECLKIGGLNENALNTLEHYLSKENEKINANRLNEICELLKIKIILKDETNDHNRIYGEKYDESYNIGLLYEHYFINEITIYTSYAIKNYKDIKEMEDWNKIYCYPYKKRNDRFITSYELIKLMMENNMFEEINEPLLITNNTTSELKYLETEDTYKKIIYENESNETDNYDKIFFDIETYNDENRIHIPYCICYYNITTGDKNGIIGEKCIIQFLNTLKNNTILYAHNAKYDYNFLIKHTYNLLEYKRNGKLILLKSMYKNRTIIINDTLSKIPLPLRDFAKAFKIENMKKEIIPYKLYCEKNAIIKRYFKIDYVIEKYINLIDKNEFINNIKKWNLENENDEYDILGYSKHYCMIDVEIMTKGYLIFKEWIKKSCDINIDKCLTITSISKNYIIKNNGFKNCYSISGVPQKFILESIDGGRCVTNNNKKHYIKEKIVLLDYVSLYPSAIIRLCEELGGLLKGKPNIILKDTNYEQLSKYDGYVVEINIKKINKKRKIPSIYKRSNDKKEYTNNIENLKMVVNKIKLEDLIKYHKIEFEIINGLYWNSGRNNKSGEIFRNIFNERIKMKEQNNQMELVYKLLMNSAYGFTLMKKNDTKTKFINGTDELISYLEANEKNVNMFIKYDEEKYKVEITETDINNYNLCHIGSEILSMAHRMMNEIIYLCEDNNIDVYYQDTDSIKIKEKDKEKIELLYEKTFKKQLCGKNLGQLHNDYKLIYYKNNNNEIVTDKAGYVIDNNYCKDYYIKNECKNVKGLESIIVAKKIYLDIVEGITENNEIIKGYYFRMKGIPNSCVYYTANKLNITIKELYELLYDGISIKFDLTEGGNKDCFEFSKTYTILTKNEMSREIQIENKNEDYEYC